MNLLSKQKCDFTITIDSTITIISPNIIEQVLWTYYQSKSVIPRYNNFTEHYLTISKHYLRIYTRGILFHILTPKRYQVQGK